MCPDTQIKSIKKATQTVTLKTLKYKRKTQVIHIYLVRVYGGFFSFSQSIVLCIIRSELSTDHNEGQQKLYRNFNIPRIQYDRSFNNPHRTQMASQQCDKINAYSLLVTEQ